MIQTKFDISTLIFNNLPVGVFFQDASGEILTVNQKYKETIGLTEYETSHTHWLEYVPETSRISVKASWEKSVENKSPLDITCEILKNQNIKIWVDVKLKPVYAESEFLGFIGTISDVTTRAMFEKVLERFKKAVEKTDALIIFTDADGTVLYANEAIEKTTGFTSAEVIGRKAGKAWGMLMEKEFYTNLWDTIKNKKEPFEAEMINKRKSGESFYSNVSITPILDQTGKVEFFVGIIKDITISKEIDKVKTEFISLASHQLRTPLSSIRWLVELLGQEDSQSLSKDQMEILGKIKKENDRLIRLVNSLLTISRAESGKIVLTNSDIDIEQFVSKIIEETKQTLSQKNLSIEVENTASTKILSGDEKLIYEAVRNLLNNSIKYTNTNGKIWFKVKSDDRNISFIVMDDGVGIPKNEQHRVFQKFFRASNVVYKEGEGSGLGLFFVQWVASAHGGKVEFKSEENVGTTFTLSFPITAKN